MAPKKGQKMSLNEFLGDKAFGSWADEMDDFPTAPSGRADDAPRGSALSRAPDRGDRGPLPPREDIPIPTQPPYTAFVGNLPFDVTESELGAHFGPHKTKSVKIIKDRDDKPKGFGYVEFDAVDGLKAAIEKTGTTISGRTIRVSVADPPKEREGRPERNLDDDRQWRRDGPLPERSSAPFERRGSRQTDDGFGSRFKDQAERLPPSIAEENTDWRSTARATAAPPPKSHFPPHVGEEGGAGMKRRGSAFSNAGPDHPSETEDKWTFGSKLKPAVERDGPPTYGRKFSGTPRPAGPEGSAPPPSASDEVNDWRSSRKVTPTTSNNVTRQNSSENSPAGPPVRRKLVLEPRTSYSAVPSPIGSPKAVSSATSPVPGSSKPDPFGGARPVDASVREKEITEKIERTKITTKEQAPPAKAWGEKSTYESRADREGPWSRGGSRAGSEKGYGSPRATPTTILSREPAQSAESSKPAKETPPARTSFRAPPPPPLNRNSSIPEKKAPSGPPTGNIRPAFSFAKAAGGGSASDGVWARKGAPSTSTGKPQQQPSPPESDSGAKA